MAACIHIEVFSQSEKSFRSPDHDVIQNGGLLGFITRWLKFPICSVDRIWVGGIKNSRKMVENSKILPGANFTDLPGTLVPLGRVNLPW